MECIVDQDIGRTLSGKASGSDGEHIGPMTSTIGDQQDPADDAICEVTGRKQSIS